MVSISVEQRVLEYVEDRRVCYDELCIAFDEGIVNHLLDQRKLWMLPDGRIYLFGEE